MLYAALGIQGKRVCAWLVALLVVLTAEAAGLRVSVLTPQMLRLEYSAAGFDEPLELVAGDGEVRHFEKDGFAFIETGRLTLRYLPEAEIIPDAKDADVLRISFRHANHNVIWYPGKDDAMNLLGTLPREVAGTNTADRNLLQKGLASRAGWAVVELAPTQDGSFDWLFLGYGYDYEQAVKDFQRFFPERIEQERTFHTSQDLRIAPFLAATAANVGTTYRGPSWDSTLTDDEGVIRWMQLSAFLPVEAYHTPDSVFEARFDSLEFGYAYRRAFQLQHSMQTYCDSIQALGQSLVRPLYYDFPMENNAYIYEDEFLVGHDILVAPITRPAGEDGMARRSVWLPAGRWYDVVNHQHREGPLFLKMECGLSEVPYFKRITN